MSDPHGHGHGGESKSIEISPTTFAIVLVVFIAFVIYFYFNPDSADSFIFYLHILQVVSVFAISFMAYKLWNFMKLFNKNGTEIIHNYESKLKHHHEHVDEKENLKNKYALAMNHFKSPDEGSWKIGLVELDNFIRVALLDFGYVGATTLELVNDAKQKGLKNIEVAEDIAFLRQRLKAKGLQFDFSKQELEILVDKFDAFKKTILPEEEHGDEHGHEHHDEHPKH